MAEKLSDVCIYTAQTRYLKSEAESNFSQIQWKNKASVCFPDGIVRLRHVIHPSARMSD